MNASKFIAGPLRFGGSVAVVSIAISFLIMIIAVTVSSGFREEIRDGISNLTGDVQLLPADLNYISDEAPIASTSSYLSRIDSLKEVKNIVPVVYRAGIIKHSGEIHGVLFKGVPRKQDPDDTVRFGVSIPNRLSDLLGVGVGDKLPTYFVGSSVKVRNFTVTDIYEAVFDGTDNIIVFSDIRDLQRLNGWDSDEVSALEVALSPNYRDAAQMDRVADEIGYMALQMDNDEDDSLVAMSVVKRYSQIFDWLNLIDFNVLIILILMTIVAGFNMISGLLIMLFRNISTIGNLKAMGMTDRSISAVFLRVASGIVLKGMLVGNVLSLALCAIQGFTHVLKLNPENYFVSFVPVHLNVQMILVSDVVAYLVIMLLLLIPCMFISRVDPAQTVRTQ